MRSILISVHNILFIGLVLLMVCTVFQITTGLKCQTYD